MTPPPATLAQMHDRYEAMPVKGSVPCGVMQRTVAAPFTCAGVGLHSGADVSFTLNPAPANTGIVFIRTDIENPCRGVNPSSFRPCLSGDIMFHDWQFLWCDSWDG